MFRLHSTVLTSGEGVMYQPTDFAPSATVPEETSFEQQILLQTASLRIHARYLCRNRTEAEDLVQEVLLRALQYRSQFHPGTNLRAWLRTIMRNTFLLRRRRREREIGCGPDLAERMLVTSIDPTVAMELDEVRRALFLLPTRYRDALVLAAGGHSYDEMSCVLGCAVGTVKSRLSRARDLLQAVLREGEFRAFAHSSDPLARLESDHASLMSGHPETPRLAAAH